METCLWMLKTFRHMACLWSRRRTHVSKHHQDGHLGMFLVSFKCKISPWKFCRFCKRHKEFLSSDGTFACKLPPHLEARVATFRSVLVQLHREKQFPAFQVGAMDEMCFHFSQVTDKKTSCALRHPGMESSNCTVILAATADGNLLPPFVVFKVRLL